MKLTRHQRREAARMWLPYPKNARQRAVFANTLRNMIAAAELEPDEVSPEALPHLLEFHELIEPPVYPEAAADYSIIRLVDCRTLIRRSRVYESTAGPPRPGTNENGPELRGSRGRHSCSSDASTRPANLTRIAEKNQPEFSGRENCAQKPGAFSATRDLEQEGLADDTHRKTRH